MKVLFILLALVGWISTQSAETLELRELLTELKKELADEEKIEAKSGPTVAVEDIYSMLSKRSQVEDVAMEEVLGELMDHHIVESNKKSATYKRGQPSDCDPNPCAQGGRCSYTDHGPDAEYQCYGCQKNFKGVSCNIFVPCGIKDQPSSNPCRLSPSGIRCIPTTSNFAGYYCIN